MQRFARPFRIRVLTIDFLEFLDRLLGVLLRVEKIEALVVEPVGGLHRAACRPFWRKGRSCCRRQGSPPAAAIGASTGDSATSRPRFRRS